MSTEPQAKERERKRPPALLIERADARPVASAPKEESGAAPDAGLLQRPLGARHVEPPSPMTPSSPKPKSGSSGGAQRKPPLTITVSPRHAEQAESGAAKGSGKKNWPVRVAVVGLGLGTLLFLLVLVGLYASNQSTIADNEHVQGYWWLVLVGTPLFAAFGAAQVFLWRRTPSDWLNGVTCCVLPLLVLVIAGSIYAAHAEQAPGGLAVALALFFGAPLCVAVWKFLREFRRLTLDRQLWGTTCATLVTCFGVAGPVALIPLIVVVNSVSSWNFFVAVLVIAVAGLALVWAIVHRCIYTFSDNHSALLAVATATAQNPPPSPGRWGSVSPRASLVAQTAEQARQRRRQLRAHQASSAIVFLVIIAVLVWCTLLAHDEQYILEERLLIAAIGAAFAWFVVSCVTLADLGLFEHEKWAVVAAFVVLSQVILLPVYHKIVTEDEVNQTIGENRHITWLLRRVFLWLSIFMPVGALVFHSISYAARTGLLARWLRWPASWIPLDYPVMTGVMALTLLLPFGVVLPLLLVFWHLYTPEDRTTYFYVISLVGSAPWMVAALRICYVWTPRAVAALRVQNPLSQLAGACKSLDITALYSWIIGTITVVSMSLLLVVVNLLSNNNDEVAINVTVLAATPFFVKIMLEGTRRVDRLAAKYAQCFVCFVVLPVLILTVAYSREASEEMQASIGVLAVGFPAASVLVMLLWAVSDFFGGERSVGAFGMTLCCTFVFFPVFVLVPALLWSNLLPSFSKGDAVGVISVATMAAVSLASIALNSKLKRMEEEKRAKLAVYLLKRNLRSTSVKLNSEIGRIVFDEYAVLKQADNGDSAETPLKLFEEWLQSRSIVYWIEHPEQDRMEVVLVEDLQEIMASDDVAETLQAIQQRQQMGVAASKAPASKPPAQPRESALAVLCSCCRPSARVVAEPSLARRPTAVGAYASDASPVNTPSALELDSPRRESVAKGDEAIASVPDSPRKQLLWESAKQRIKQSGRGKWKLVNHSKADAALHRERMLQRVFDFYATSEHQRQGRTGSFSGTPVGRAADSVKHISMAQFRTFVRDCRLTGARFPPAQIDLIFVKLTKQHISSAQTTVMTFNLFKAGLHELAALKYPELLRAGELVALSPAATEQKAGGRNGGVGEIAANALRHVQAPSQASSEAAAATPAPRTDTTSAYERLVCDVVLQYAHHTAVEPGAAVLDPQAPEAQMAKMVERTDVAYPALAALPASASLLDEQQQVFEKQMKREQEEQKRRQKRKRNWNRCLSCLPGFAVGSVTIRNKNGIEETVDLDADSDVDEEIDALAAEAKHSSDHAAPPEVESRDRSHSVESAAGGEPKSEQLVAKTESKPRAAMPTWEQCVRVMVATLDELEKDNNSVNQVQNHPIEANAANVLELLSMVVDCLTMMSLVFDARVDWDFGQITQNVVSAPVLTFSTSDGSVFTSLYWLCFCVAIVYAALAVPGLHLARKGVLGLGADGLPARWNSGAFWFAKSLDIFGSMLYFPVLIKLIQVYVCQQDTADVERMLFAPEVQCWSSEHIAYCVCSALALLLYYPMASFLYPNIQFVDRSLEVKFSTTYLIFCAQGKLFLAGIASFYPYEPYTLLCWAAVIYFSLWWLTDSMRPCLAHRINRWRSLLYALPLWAAVCGLVVQSSSNTAAALGLLAAGWALLLAWAVRGHLREFGAFQLEMAKVTAQSPPQATAAGAAALQAGVQLEVELSPAASSRSAHVSHVEMQPLPRDSTAVSISPSDAD